MNAAEFADSLEVEAAEIEARNRAIFVGCTERVRSGLQSGDPVTGAPGQPVDTGALLGSFQSEYEGPWQSFVGTDKAYAEAIEEGQQQPYTTAKGTPVTPGPMHFRSPVGGPHSVALTYAGWGAVVDAVVAEQVRE